MPTKKPPSKAPPKKPPKAPELPTLAFDSAAALDAWLARNHATAPGVWLKLAKKATKVPSVTYPEAVELALVYGWIDGQKRPLDESAWLQKLTPRGARSIWSKINCAKALALIEAGRMHAAGRAEVERAQADGRWDKAYDSPRTAEIPSGRASFFVTAWPPAGAARRACG